MSEDLIDRVLQILQSRFPHQFEICVLQAQNDALREKVSELDWDSTDSELLDDEQS